jgi:hypothetical protein
MRNGVYLEPLGLLSGDVDGSKAARRRTTP